MKRAFGRAAAGYAIALVLALVSTPGPGAAQQPAKVPRVGLLTPSSVSYDWTLAVRWLDELGYVDGRNIAFESRSAAGRDDRLPELAAELVRLKVDVIVTAGTPGIRAARQATATIPIVMIANQDPVAAGFVASLARPGGNITGVAVGVPELAAKRLELLRDAVPRLARVAVLWNPRDPDLQAEWQATRAAARALGLEVQPVEVRSRDDLEGAFAGPVVKRSGGMVVLADSVTWSQAKQIGVLAARQRVPVVYPQRWFVDVFDHGGLMSYGPSHLDISRRAAAYVDRILKGARPAELPVERPSTYELVVNLRAARAIGLSLPQSLLVRADRVVE
jgi:putative ABC transport system substrate-binding protein